MTLVEFLNARLDDDEQTARDATCHGRWGWHIPNETTVLVFDDQTRADVAHAFRGEPDAEHIARHDPARVLREVEAKRQIIATHVTFGGFQDEEETDHGHGCQECGWNAEYSDRGGWCTTLRLLALPYTDHPEFKEEWRL